MVWIKHPLNNIFIVSMLAFELLGAFRSKPPCINHTLASVNVIYSQCLFSSRFSSHRQSQEQVNANPCDHSHYPPWSKGGGPPSDHKQRRRQETSPTAASPKLPIVMRHYGLHWNGVYVDHEDEAGLNVALLLLISNWWDVFLQHNWLGLKVKEHLCVSLSHAAVIQYHFVLMRAHFNFWIYLFLSRSGWSWIIKTAAWIRLGYELQKWSIPAWRHRLSVSNVERP